MSSSDQANVNRSMILWCLDDHQMLVQPACGAALSAVYSNVLQKLKDEGKLKELTDVVVIVCGGSGVSLAKLREWENSVGIVDQR